LPLLKKGTALAGTSTVSPGRAQSPDRRDRRCASQGRALLQERQGAARAAERRGRL